MKDNGAHGFTESAEVPKEGSEPIKLTEVGGSEKIPKESIIKFLYGSSSYKGYWYGDIPPGKPSFWWRNLLREEIEAKDAENERLKSELAEVKRFLQELYHSGNKVVPELWRVRMQRFVK